jgi:hypothetical protein
MNGLDGRDAQTTKPRAMYLGVKREQDVRVMARRHIAFWQAGGGSNA